MADPTTPAAPEVAAPDSKTLHIPATAVAKYMDMLAQHLSMVAAEINAASGNLKKQIAAATAAPESTEK